MPPSSHAAVHAFQLDVAAGDGNIPGFLTAPFQGQGHLGTIPAPDLLHHLVQVLAVQVFPVDLQQDISGFDAGFVGRSVLNGRHHHKLAVLFLSHHHAHAAKMTFRHGGEGLEILVVQVGGIGVVQDPHHAFERAIINGFPIGFPHIMFLDQVHGPDDLEKGSRVSDPVFHQIICPAAENTQGQEEYPQHLENGKSLFEHSLPLWDAARQHPCHWSLVTGRQTPGVCH